LWLRAWRIIMNTVLIKTSIKYARVYGSCWQKALYDNAFCQYGPWSRVFGTQYPCSRAVFPWTRVLFWTLVNTTGVNACDTPTRPFFDTLPATWVLCTELKGQTVLSLQVVKASFVLPSCDSDNSRLWKYDLGRTLKRSIGSVHFDTGVQKMPVHPSTRTVFTVVRVHGRPCSRFFGTHYPRSRAVSTGTAPH